MISSVASQDGMFSVIGTRKIRYYVLCVQFRAQQESPSERHSRRPPCQRFAPRHTVKSASSFPVIVSRNLNDSAMISHFRLATLPESREALFLPSCIGVVLHLRVEISFDSESYCRVVDTSRILRCAPKTVHRLPRVLYSRFFR